MNWPTLNKIAIIISIISGSVGVFGLILRFYFKKQNKKYNVQLIIPPNFNDEDITYLLGKIKEYLPLDNNITFNRQTDNVLSVNLKNTENVSVFFKKFKKIISGDSNVKHAWMDYKEIYANYSKDNTILKINPSKVNPFVYINSIDGIMDIKGVSIPENANELYDPIINFIKDILTNKVITKFNVCFDLLYFNTSSSKLILDIFMLLKKMEKSNIKVNIKWYYIEDDEEMQENGEDFRDINKLKLFEIIEKKDETEF